jgi:monoamine oxidase
VLGVNLTDKGVSVEYRQDGQTHAIEADYCFNCIPSHFMSGIENNLPADYMQAMKYIRRGTAYKGAFQAKERFWEKQGIYGGISWTNQPIRQIWYPPHGIHKEKGVVLAAYDYGNGMRVHAHDPGTAHRSDDCSGRESASGLPSAWSRKASPLRGTA